MVNLKMATQYNVLLNNYICLLFIIETNIEKILLSLSFNIVHV
jgi:hypothetical protein